MKSKVIKSIFILIILIILVSINTETLAWSPIKDMGDDFIKTGEQSGTSTVDDVKMTDLSSYLYSILLSAGVIVAVVVATVLGIQFMVGGAEGQAKVKEMLVPFIVGCIVVFGGFGFWKIALTVGEKIEGASPSITTPDEPGDNQFDFTERKCVNCGVTGTPRYDECKHIYVCTYCGNTMSDTPEVRCSRCGSIVQAGYMDGKNICPMCGNKW